MGIDVRLQTQRGDPVDYVGDRPGNLPYFLETFYDDIKERNYYFLQGIDPYGDTIFNSLQMLRFLEEWDWLTAKASTNEEREFLAKVRRMAERCRDEVHLYLKFIGD
jgi:hypothetical protein